jgi:hypothetical protein
MLITEIDEKAVQQAFRAENGMRSPCYSGSKAIVIDGEERPRLRRASAGDWRLARSFGGQEGQGSSFTLFRMTEDECPFQTMPGNLSSRISLVLAGVGLGFGASARSLCPQGALGKEEAV